jgi:hypothetical protein
MTLTATTSGFGLDELEPGELLERVARAETAERAAALSKVELAVRWCVAHPATADTGAAVWGDSGLPGLVDCDETLGGDGCPLVSAHAPEPFAAALGVSTTTGMQLLADALDLTHRLPLIWQRVRRLEVPAWKACRVARATHGLSREAAARVDIQLADRLASSTAPSEEASCLGGTRQHDVRATTSSARQGSVDGVEHDVDQAPAPATAVGDAGRDGSETHLEARVLHLLQEDLGVCDSPVSLAVDGLGGGVDANADRVDVEVPREGGLVVVIEGVVPKSSFERGEVVHEMNART